ncbi:MAG: DUF4381 domain-containing protein [Methylococcales bacterium]|nr:DUF4381 domain-containing protein [Methylococcales bacterium]MDP7562477.1 DUF4381 domain-containing protein [Methylococcales bacterium]
MPSNPLAIRDIHLPDPIIWWPPAFGWWLALLLTITVILLMFWSYKKITRKTAVKSARHLLSQIQMKKDWDDPRKLTALSALLRRTAISVYPPEQVASLTGQAWLEFLDRPFKEKKFSSIQGQQLINNPYQRTINSDLKPLFEFSEQWLTAVKGNEK